jgi:hypothetical protein
VRAGFKRRSCRAGHPDLVPIAVTYALPLDPYSGGLLCGSLKLGWVRVPGVLGAFIAATTSLAESAVHRVRGGSIPYMAAVAVCRSWAAIPGDTVLRAVVSPCSHLRRGLRRSSAGRAWGVKLAAWFRKCRSARCAEVRALSNYIRISAPSRIRTYAHDSGGCSSFPSLPAQTAKQDVGWSTSGPQIGKRPIFRRLGVSRRIHRRSSDRAIRRAGPPWVPVSTPCFHSRR